MRRTPADGEPHERTWMTWSSDEAVGTGASGSASQEALAEAIAAFEPLTVLTSPGRAASIRARVGRHVDVLEVPDGGHRLAATGPTFVLLPEGVQAVVHGADPPGRSRLRLRLRRRGSAATFTEQAGVEAVGSRLALGSLRSDGWGTVLATEPALLGAGLDRAEAEAEIVRLTGALRVIWLPAGLGDPAEGHVDPMATFAAPGVILVHDQMAEVHPDHDGSEAVVSALEQARDSRGLRLRVVRVPAPGRLRDAAGGWLHQSYLGHVLVNGGLVVPSYDDARDGEVVELLAAVHPGREVVVVDARPLSTTGHGLRCRTVSQPAERAAPARNGRSDAEVIEAPV